MNIQLSKFIAGFALATTALSSSAATISESAPFLGSGLFGEESDTATSAFSATVSLPATNSLVSQIEWWGYHGPDSAGGPLTDQFDLSLGSTALAWGTYTLGLDESNLEAVHYTATGFTPFAASASVQLAISNIDTNAEWFWRASSIDSQGLATSLAYSIQSPTAPVPEPSALLMLAAGLAVLGLAKHKRRAS